MDKTTLIQYIQYEIRTTDSGMADVPEIGFRLNRSLERLSARIDLKKSIQQSNIAYIGDGAYAVPTEFKAPISLYDPTTLQFLSRISKEEFDRTPANTDLSYAVYGGNIYIRARGSASTMVLTYLTNYTAQTNVGALRKGLDANTDEPLVQEMFHQYHVFDVAAEIHRKARKYEDYKIASLERDKLLKDIEDENPKVEQKIIEGITPYDVSYEDTFSV